MEQRNTPEFILEAFADPNSVRDVVQGSFRRGWFSPGPQVETAFTPVKFPSSTS